MGVPNTSSSLDLIVDRLIPVSPKSQKRSEVQVSDVIKSTFHVKLLSCKFKKTANVEVYCTDGSCQIPLSGLLIDAFSSLFFLVEEGDVE
ncbi:hypothetical protein Tco_1414060 [Tanacetum coccineum]